MAQKSEKPRKFELSNFLTPTEVTALILIVVLLLLGAAVSYYRRGTL